MKGTPSSSWSAFPFSTSSSTLGCEVPHETLSGRTAKVPSVAAAPPFVELLARSCFSFLQGASHPEEMVSRALKLGYRGLGICDVNGLYGVVRGYQAAERPSAFDAEALSTVAEAAARGPFQYLVGAELTPYDASPIALMPLNRDGYARLSHLITAAKRPAPKGRIALSAHKIQQENEDLLAFPFPPWSTDELRRWQDAFQDRLYLPVCKDLTWSAVALYQQALRLERDLKIPAFATQRPLFHSPERKPLFDVLTCILHGSTLAEANVKLAPNGERALKPLAELARRWGERPDLLARTAEIASLVSFSLKELRYRYPREALPLRAGKRPVPADFLRELVEAGLRSRFPEGPSQGVMAQAERELSLVRELEYEDYFLTIWDICAFARERGILHQGRGSAANSVVCFALGITSVDPVAMGLLFERFISRERGEPPDIDVDFEHERREEVIQYIYDKYGAKRAAMVCTTICYRSRMAVRDVAKVLGFSSEEIETLVKRMGREGLRRLLQETRAEGDAPASGPRSKLGWLLYLAGEIQGFPRHLGIHSGGFVIAHDPITDVVPVEKAAMDGRYVIQWNKDDINTLGLMKIDVLSLGMLTALRKAFSLLKGRKGLDLGLGKISLDDAASYEAACAADTVGVFQIESRAQMSLLPRLKPRSYYDLVVEVAIVRPGPIQGGMVHPYLRRREQKEKVVYPHPSLEPILKKTLGVPLFQEQIMQIAVAVAGFTPGEADELRRIMSSHWNRPNVMDGLRQRLIGGMLSSGLKPEFAEQIYKTIQGFSAYGFPESHAASFALLTYASLYLKRHHPDVFACALLNSQPMGFYAPRTLIADAQRHGVAFLPLDIQKSNWDYELEEEEDKEHVARSSRISWECVLPPHESSGEVRKQGLNALGQGRASKRVPSNKLINSQNFSSASHASQSTQANANLAFDEKKFSTINAANASAEAPNFPCGMPSKFAVRAGFRSIYGLPRAAVDKLVHERQAGGPFQSLEDFARRVRPSRAALMKLAAAGALQAASSGSEERSPLETIWSVQGFCLDPQSLLFGRSAFSGATARPDDDKLSEGALFLPPESEWRALQREYRSHGFSLHAHPLSVLRSSLLPQRPRFSTATDLARKRHRERVRAAGLLAMLQKPPTAKGVCFLSLEDETGLFNAVLTPDVYEAHRSVLFSSPLLDIVGLLESRSGVRNIRAESIRPLRPPPSSDAAEPAPTTDADARATGDDAHEDRRNLLRRAGARMYAPSGRR